NCTPLPKYHHDATLDYEDWKTDSSYVQKTFALGMENIVISTLLKKLLINIRRHHPFLFLCGCWD
ncbi:hypothetical protein VSS53_09750, partial [Lactobacillus delbrueckii subsp. allosunkii]|uniref:hypothetical protein n=1 Tax=Lactobacillus delbrueckii TaxID=1584 RepID=UPI003A835AC3